MAVDMDPLRAGNENEQGAKPAPPAFGSSFVVESLHTPWWKTFLADVGEAFRPQEQLPPPPKYRDPLPGEDTLDFSLNTVRGSWYQNIAEYFRVSEEEKKLPSFEATSKPIAVKNIWGAYDNRKAGFPWSVAFHALVIVLIFTVFRSHPIDLKTGSVTLLIPVDMEPYLLELSKLQGRAKDSGGGGGGGQNSPLPPSKGKLPRFDMKQLAPPTPVIRNENPKLAVEPTVIVQPDANVPQIDMNVFGDPLGKIGPPSAGPGSGGGIGTGKGGGVGSGTGAGVGPGQGGGFGGGVYRVGGGVSAPKLTRKVDPEYSEEARKAKYQGTVLLQVEVWPDGRAHNVRVIRSLGLGLDEKAIEAVQQWEFVPGKKDGQSVKVAASVEVNFRLL